jgi:hypothetical protein
MSLFSCDMRVSVIFQNCGYENSIISFGYLFVPGIRNNVAYNTGTTIMVRIVPNDEEPVDTIREKNRKNAIGFISSLMIH